MGCPWAAHSSNLGSTFWNRIPYLFPVSYSPKQNLMHKFQPNSPHQFLEVHGCPRSLKKIPQFGPMFWDRSYGPFPTFFISIHNLFNKSSNMAPKQPLTSRLQILGFNKFNKFDPKFWDRSNGRSRPQANRNIEKHLNRV